MNENNNKYYGIIYKITNLVNNKVYIGQTTKPRGFKDRYPNKGTGIERVYRYHKKNKNRGDGYNIKLFRAIEKYGFENFVVDEVFDTAQTQEELDQKEIDYIKQYDSFHNGYNNTDGGGGTKGTKALSGKECPVSRSVYQISLDGKLLKKWDCISDVSKELGIDSSKISCVCRGQRATAQGFVWVYVEDYDERIDYSRKPRQKERKKGVKQVVQLSYDEKTIIKEFKSVNDASRQLGISTTEVSRICKNKYKRSKKLREYHLKYKSEYFKGATTERVEVA